MRDDELLKLIADHMENGFLENIIDMFKHDRSLYRFLPELMSDARGRVRLGMVALVEALIDEHNEEVSTSVTGIAALLGSEELTVRADAAYLLGIIGDSSAIAYLKESEKKETVEPVRQVIAETIKELSGE